MKYQDILNAFNSALRPLFDKLEQIRCALGTPTTPTDEEHFYLCDPNGARVRVTYVAGNPVPVSMTYLDGTPYLGGINTLVECNISDTDPVCFDVCVNGVNYRQCVLTVGGVPTGLPGDIYYLDVNGVLVPVPVGTPIPGRCNDGIQIFKTCRCDDVNGNGSLIVNYNEFYTVDPVTGVPTVLSTYTDPPWTPYVPVNPVDCNTLGNTVSLVLRRVHLTGIFSWSLPATAQSITIKVRRTNPIVLPTISDNAANVTPLLTGDVETFSHLGDQSTVPQWITGNFTVNSGHADTIITISYTEIL